MYAPWTIDRIRYMGGGLLLRYVCPHADPLLRHRTSAGHLETMPGHPMTVSLSNGIMILGSTTIVRTCCIPLAGIF
jgi:hypothetical protein